MQPEQGFMFKALVRVFTKRGLVLNAIDHFLIRNSSLLKYYFEVSL